MSMGVENVFTHDQSLSSVFDRWMEKLCCILVLLWLGFEFSIYTWHGTYSFWNQIRLAPSYALSLGAPLYGNIETDPLIWHLYGPFAPAFYYPAILTSNPFTALVIGICMSWGGVLISLWSCLRVWGYSIQRSLLGLLFIFTPLFYFPVSWDLFRIIVDVPALALGLAAIALAWKGRSFECGLFVLLSIATKQTFFPIGGMALWILLQMGGSLRGFVTGFAGGSIPFLFVLGITCQIRPMIESTILLPLAQPWKSLEGLLHPLPYLTSSQIMGDGESHLQMYIWSFLGEERWLMEGFILSWLFSRRGANRADQRIISSCSLIGILFYPVGVLQFCKVGGATNSFFPAIFLFYLTAALWIFKMMTPDEPRISLPGKITMILLLSLMTGIGLQTLSRMNDLMSLNTHPALEAFDELTVKPGSRYERHQPLSQMMAEKRIYHIADVIQSHHLAGRVISEENQRRWLPPGSRLIAPRFWEKLTLPQKSEK
jgi:hypothetical protein